MKLGPRPGHVGAARLEAKGPLVPGVGNFEAHLLEGGLEVALEAREAANQRRAGNGGQQPDLVGPVEDLLPARALSLRGVVQKFQRLGGRLEGGFSRGGEGEHLGGDNRAGHLLGPGGALFGQARGEGEVEVGIGDLPAAFDNRTKAGEGAHGRRDFKGDEFHARLIPVGGSAERSGAAGG